MYCGGCGQGPQASSYSSIVASFFSEHVDIENNFTDMNRELDGAVRWYIEVMGTRLLLVSIDYCLIWFEYLRTRGMIVRIITIIEELLVLLI